MRREGKLKGWTYTSYRVHTIPRDHFFARPAPDADGVTVGHVGSASTFFCLGGRPSSKTRVSAYACPLGRRCNCCRNKPGTAALCKAKGALKESARRVAALEAEGSEEAADLGWFSEQVGEEDLACASAAEDASDSSSLPTEKATFACFFPPELLAAFSSSSGSDDDGSGGVVVEGGYVIVAADAGDPWQSDDGAASDDADTPMADCGADEQGGCGSDAGDSAASASDWVLVE